MEIIRSRAQCRCLFVPGNHDIWVDQHPGMDSLQIYSALQEMPDNLSSGPVSLTGDWLAIGDLGWYDYSFGASNYSKEDFDRMRFGERVWQDSIKAVWNISTVQQHRIFYDKLKAQLEEHSDKRIIFITHVLPIVDFTVRNRNEMWNYLNAFLGSKEYGDLVCQHSNVEYCISGHVHFRKRATIGKTEFICNCLGYTDEWKTGSDPFVEVPAAMTTLEI
jgi:putative phosphoesterase